MTGSNHWIKITVFLLAAVLSSAAQDKGLEITGFRVPEYNEQSEMTSQLFGDRAVMEGNGKVRIIKANMEFYRGEETFMVVKSPYCIYDQKTNQAHSDAPVAADMDGVRVRGRGFELASNTRIVNILNDCVVTIDDLMQQSADEAAAAAPADTNQATVITSETLFLDYSGRKVRFEGTVHVQDPKMSMDCETMDVGFSESNEIDWIEAFTNVKLLSEGRVATAGKAVYNLKNEEFLLEDNPVIHEGRNMLTGDRIQFQRSSGRMVCEPSARLIIYPDQDEDQNATNIFGD